MTTARVPVTPADTPAIRPLAKKRGRPGDAIFHGALLLAVGLALGALVWLLGTILVQGLPRLSWDFIWDKTSTNPDKAGFGSALRGSLVLMMITIAVALPVGFAGAVYLEKFAALSRDQLLGVARRRERLVNERVTSGRYGVGRARLARLGVRARYSWARIGPPVNTALEVNISNLAAVPSIIYGLLGLAVFIAIMGISKSLLAGGLTLALLILPIIIIASREAVRAVPVSIEQGAMALGATRWQAVSRQVVPAAFPGMLTGAILAVSRAIGESAPLIVVGGISFGTQLPSINPLESGDTPLFAMPLQIYFWADQPREEFRELAASGIIVLLGTLLVVNLVAIFLRNRYTRRW